MKKYYSSPDRDKIAEISKIRRKIEELRMELYEKAKERSFTDPVVLEANRKFNRMLNQYERLIFKR